MHEQRTIRIQGTVQGVGFRPFVYRLASRLGVCGDVRNNAGGVVIRAVAESGVLNRFVALLREEAPPLAVIRFIDSERGPLPAAAPSGFTVTESEGGGAAAVDIPCDVATCGPCLAELRDATDRRHGHAFINCTDCGPRYTIIAALPYDRPNTTMAPFTMCPACRAEYGDQASRRFHAQPVCCPECGPRLSILDGEGNRAGEGAPIEACIDRLREGKIIAIKGIGGFHLACRADRDDVVQELRRRKGREEKPFALMLRDLKAAAKIVVLSDEEARLLESVERPIVLGAKRPRPAFPISDSVAPGLTTFGIMLPYAPLHHLLFDRSDFQALVMTSANRSDEPMVHDNAVALKTLRSIADFFLVHDRPILTRVDDSIARVTAAGPLLLRRGRGFVPEPLPAPCGVTGIVGCGGVLKTTVTVGRGASCFVSQYAGSAECLETLEQLEGIKRHLLRVLGVTPSLYAADLHPGAATAAIADAGVPLLRVQHHHAHAAACMAENRIEGSAVCVVYDGTGYGGDGTLWGGEIFFGGYERFERAGHLAPMLMPGGEAAILHPWRMAMGALHGTLGGDEVGRLFPTVPSAEKQAVAQMLAADVSCVKTSGMGRLFDAMSALLGVCLRRSYEGQPAILLEGIAAAEERSAYDGTVEQEKRGDVLIHGPRILADAIRDLAAGTAPPVVAARFHNTVAKATAAAVALIAARCGTDLVCLSGGCFQNALLLNRTLYFLQRSGLRPHTHRLVPPNDESISYGQTVIAGMRGSAPDPGTMERRR
jgi:hydrogenase maturation protein HypF